MVRAARCCMAQVFAIMHIYIVSVQSKKCVLESCINKASRVTPACSSLVHLLSSVAVHCFRPFLKCAKWSKT